MTADSLTGWTVHADRPECRLFCTLMLVILYGGVVLADREWLAAHHGLSPVTIRKLLTPNRVDPFTGRALYDVETADQVLRGRKPRKRSK